MKHFAIVSVMLAVGSGLLLRGLTAAEEKVAVVTSSGSGLRIRPAKNSQVAVGTAPGRRPPKLRVLDLEDAIGRAELIVAVRLVDMSESKIVHGGKMEVVTQQFRFEPVRTIKGIFARDCAPAHRPGPGHLPVRRRGRSARTRPNAASPAGTPGSGLRQLQHR